MLSFQTPELKLRDPDNKAADQAALQALAQAAINVELFTIPLYMVSMYSIQGMHQITSAGNDFYQGRLWPGASPSPNPATAPNPSNALAFNHFFSVFIDEMLHLQLASNIAKALGVMPTYNSPMLQDKNYGWTCYADTTVIPHILDFQDCIAPYNEITVKLDALTLDQNALFLAIEENEDDARGIIDPNKTGNYFPPVPFADWSANNTEADLPMFGTIGWMYKCLWQYMEIEYTDGTSLFEIVFNRGTLERDLFNASSSYHKPEYPLMPTMASGEISVQSAMENILNMINAITDQGEGQDVAKWIRARRRGLLKYAPVEGQFRPDEDALNFDYPNYTDTGKPNNPSGATIARSKNGGLDHHDRFSEISKLLETGKVVTWDMWHTANNSWTPEMLKSDGYDQNKWPLPTAEEIASALNNLKADSGAYDTFSQAAAGSIAGITRVLSDFWTNETASFPSPSMYGSGDRVSICWAVYGKFPDITKGIADKTTGVLYHACQGMDLNTPGKNMDCAQVEVFHSCRGSNECKAEGGCGFVQVVGQSALCGHKVLLEHLSPTPPLKGGPKIYSAPSDNKCATFGGCAIPISASQLYPPPQPNQTSGGMEVIDFVGQTAEPEKIGNLQYKVGEKVYDVAWEAFIRVLQHRGVTPPEKPSDSDLRIALPPST